MTSKFKTNDVSKAAYSNYLKKAQECFHAARHSFDNERLAQKLGVDLRPKKPGPKAKN